MVFSFTECTCSLLRRGGQARWLAQVWTLETHLTPRQSFEC